MRSALNAIETKFYDPLYEVVVFTGAGGEEGSLLFWGALTKKRKEHALSASDFLGILDTYEFSRLSFLRQAGLAWLEFPSATHTRFSHSLGCWLLSKWAADDVIVSQFCDRRDSKGTLRVEQLGERLRELGFLEEFNLSLLLHDVGHFPFSHVIENNDVLLDRYAHAKQTLGIRLKHEDIGVGLITGKGTAFGLFADYVKRRFGEDTDDSQFLAAQLERIRGIEPDRIALFLQDDPSFMESIGGEDALFLAAARELVSGVIDLDRLDHYHRDSHFTSVRGGDFNIRSLLRHLALADTEENPTLRVSLIGDGVQHAFQILYAKGMLTDTVFHNEHNLAYEVMLNDAMNAHWSEASEEFRVFFPFYDDSELFEALAISPSRRARWMIQRIRRRQPLKCVGKFVLPPGVLGELGGDSEARRARFREEFRKAQRTAGILDDDECFLRLDRRFGKLDGDSEWMNLREICDRNGTPLANLVDHGKFVDYVRQREEVRARCFWVFVGRADARVRVEAMASGLLGAKSASSRGEEVQ